MSFRLKTLIAIACCSFLSVDSLAANMETTIINCEGCHGSNGVSECPDMPTIAGISAGSFEDAMFAYLDGARPCAPSEYRHGDKSRPKTDMCAIAKALSEDDISKLANHYAVKKFVAMKQTTDAAKVQAGEAVHNRDCKGCHSDGGSNPADDAGIIAGQPMGYLKTTFKEYRTEKREQPKKMKPKIDALSDEDIDALIHFYASQQ